MDSTSIDMSIVAPVVTMSTWRLVVTSAVAHHCCCRHFSYSHVVVYVNIVNADGKQTKQGKRGGQWKPVVKRQRAIKKQIEAWQRMERERSILQKPLVVRDSIDMHAFEIARQKRPPLELLLDQLHDVRIDSQACVDYVESRRAMTNKLCPSSSPAAADSSNIGS